MGEQTVGPGADSSASRSAPRGLGRATVDHGDPPVLEPATVTSVPRISRLVIVAQDRDPSVLEPRQRPRGESPSWLPSTKVGRSR